MTEEESIRLRVARDVQNLAAQAPSPDFARLWHRVRCEREGRLERRLMLLTALPPLGLLLGGIAYIFLGNSLHVAIPCCAVAFWLGPQALAAALESWPTAPVNRAATPR